jgi:hypothetical protein
MRTFKTHTIKGNLNKKNMNDLIAKGSRVAVWNGNDEWKPGWVIEMKDQKALVKFDQGYSRWCSVSTLYIIETA